MIDLRYFRLTILPRFDSRSTVRIRVENLVKSRCDVLLLVSVQDETDLGHESTCSIRYAKEGEPVLHNTFCNHVSSLTTRILTK